MERNKRGMPVIVYVKESNFFISLMLDLDIMKPEIYLELNEIGYPKTQIELVDKNCQQRIYI